MVSKILSGKTTSDCVHNLFENKLCDTIEFSSTLRLPSEWLDLDSDSKILY